MYSEGAIAESRFVFHLHGSVRVPIQRVINPLCMIESQDPVHIYTGPAYCTYRCYTLSFSAALLYVRVL
jgi:hypothetical protein